MLSTKRLDCRWVGRGRVALPTLTLSSHAVGYMHLCGNCKLCILPATALVVFSCSRKYTKPQTQDHVN